MSATSDQNKRNKNVDYLRFSFLLRHSFLVLCWKTVQNRDFGEGKAWIKYRCINWMKGMNKARMNSFIIASHWTTFYACDFFSLCCSENAYIWILIPSLIQDFSFFEFSVTVVHILLRMGLIFFFLQDIYVT